MKKTFLHKNKSGQVILIALILLGSLGLIGVSVATQMVLEQRKAVLEEKTQKAYYAAESGIEEALKEIKADPAFLGEIPLSDIGGANADVEVTEAASGQNFNVGVQLNSGEPFYFNLVGYTGNNIVLCWDKNNTSFVFSVYYTQSGTNDRKVYHYAVNTDNTIQTPRIMQGALAGGGGSNCGFNGYRITLTLKPTPIAAADTYDYLVIWPLYQNQVRIGFNGGAVSLPQQGKVITSTGTAVELDGTITRRLKFFQSVRNYPSSFLQMPFYVGGTINFGEGKNWLN